MCHITRCLSHCTASIHALSHSTRCLISHAASVHALFSSMRCLTPHTASFRTRPHSTHCLSPCAVSLYMLRTFNTVSFDALLRSTNVFSFHTLSRSTHTQYQLDYCCRPILEHREYNFIGQRLLCERCSKCLSAM